MYVFESVQEQHVEKFSYYRDKLVYPEATEA